MRGTPTVNRLPWRSIYGRRIRSGCTRCWSESTFLFKPSCSNVSDLPSRSIASPLPRRKFVKYCSVIRDVNTRSSRDGAHQVSRPRLEDVDEARDVTRRSMADCAHPPSET